LGYDEESLSKDMANNLIKKVTLSSSFMQIYLFWKAHTHTNHWFSTDWNIC